jgi:hypothetical protein
MRSVPQLLLLPVIAMIASLATTATATTSASEAKKGAVEAYAAIDIGACTILGFGGKRATAATAGSCVLGFGQVTFTGKFPTDITASKVILQTTAQSSFFDITNAYVVSATPTTIVVGISDWQSGALAPQADVDYVSVFIGQ